MGITSTIVRAELAAIAAAVLQGHSHIATDSLFSLHQIRKQTLYPELHHQHVQGHILKILSSCANHLPPFISTRQGLLPTVHEKVNNLLLDAFWTMQKLPVKMKRNICYYRTGTLFNQKHAVRFKISTSLQCPLCGDPDSALHVFLGCEQSTVSNMVTEGQNVASRIFLKGVSKGPLRAGLAIMDIGSTGPLALQNLQIPEDSINITFPSSIFRRCVPGKQRLTSSCPDATLVFMKECQRPSPVIH
eukprot:1155379-Pelagomonas_calceolata.AAC.1